jgi:3-oxoacyl-[acyl-carrier-protein] synthase-1
MLQKRVVITGMSINTPIGDTLDEFINNMMDGKSAVTKWGTLDTSRIYAKVGGDMGNYDVVAKIKTYKGRIPEAMYDRLLKLGSKSPLSIGISLLRWK